MKIAVLLCGHVRSWNICKEFFTKTFPNVDVFIHTYNNVLMYHSFIEGEINVTGNTKKLNTQDLIDIIDIDYKEIVVEDQDDVKYILPDTCPVFSDTYTQYKKIKKCNDLRLAYEKEHDIKYDLVIKTRFDINYSLCLDEMIEQYINKNKVYISQGPSIYPCDQFFLASGDNMTELCDRILNLDHPPVDTKFSPHEWVNYRMHDKLEILNRLNTYIIRINKY